MISRPVAAVLGKASSSRALEFVSTTAGVLAQIGITSYINSYLGSNETTTNPTQQQGAGAPISHTNASTSSINAVEQDHKLSSSENSNHGSEPIFRI